MTTIQRRRLGSSDLEVSALALGSWRTYERIPHDAGVAVMRKAREVGITFLDDARYNDETGHAPLKTGYSEVVFGELFRGAGWKRDEVILANKLWWEFWPEQSAAQELDGSLQRMRMDHIDLAYAERPPDGLTVDQVVRDVNDLIKSGKLRAWGVLNWPASLLEEAGLVAAELGVAGPCAAQLPYSLVMRSPVEDPAMVAALESANVGVVASYTLVGGALSGKYSQPGAEGRINGRARPARLLPRAASGRGPGPAWTAQWRSSRDASDRVRAGQPSCRVGPVRGDATGADLGEPGGDRAAAPPGSANVGGARPDRPLSPPF